MRKLFTSKLAIHAFAFLALLGVGAFLFTKDANAIPYCQQIDTGALGFKIPSLADILGFVIRIFFVIAGLAALIYMLLGAFAWITSGGDKDAIGAAREKIQAALIGMIMIVVVLALIWTLETLVFQRRVCLGLSCPVTIPGLIEAADEEPECICLTEDGTPGDTIKPLSQSCGPDGKAK